MRIHILILLAAGFHATGQTLDAKIKQRVDYGETPGIVVGVFDNGNIQY